MQIKLRIYSITLMLLFVVLAITVCNADKIKYQHQHHHHNEQTQKSASATPRSKQLELRETNPPDFVRLLIMRLIYGIATQMGLEDRAAGWLNGAFVPPNADDDDYGYDGLEALDDLGDLDDDALL